LLQVLQSSVSIRLVPLLLLHICCIHAAASAIMPAASASAAAATAAAAAIAAAAAAASLSCSCFAGFLFCLRASLPVRICSRKHQKTKRQRQEGMRL
jgi:hypothetical protein